MRPFTYESVKTVPEAIKAHAGNTTQYLAGGTGLLDLMKLDVMAPERLVDINAISAVPQASVIRVDAKGLRIGAMTRMSEAANHPDIKRDYPVFAETLSLAASSGLRNMATLGGNMLQRTRCPYFRDTAYAQCNKRTPGSGCAALDGFNRVHAVLGTSDACIATYPGDFAQALMVLDASLELQGPRGPRILPFAKLHAEPGATPQVEHTLMPGELITAITIPAAPGNKRSVYVKVRDRESYEFAIASAAVALDLADGAVKSARIALGGSRQCRGGPMRRSGLCSASRSTRGRRASRPMLLSRMPKPASTILTKFHWVRRRSCARSCKPRRWRPDR